MDLSREYAGLYQWQLPVLRQTLMSAQIVLSALLLACSYHNRHHRLRRWRQLYSDLGEINVPAPAHVLLLDWMGMVRLTSLLALPTERAITRKPTPLDFVTIIHSSRWPGVALQTRGTLSTGRSSLMRLLTGCGTHKGTLVDEPMTSQH